jgi:tRNA A-37 threonylcarbamoyl transferase component Bud32
MNESLSAAGCPRCGAVIPPGAPEDLCPKCLLVEIAAPTEAGPRQDRPAPPSLAAVAAAFPQLQIIELIGQGGMGCVFKARQPGLNRFVALKLLPESLSQNPAFAARFTREAQALAALNHPNIVTVHDFGQSGGFFYLLMEFVDGVNLRQALRGGHFTPEQALAVIPPICEALQFAHERGIVHRDVKPENLLLDKSGRIKIADFGIAKIVGLPPLLADDDAAGTPRYIAPEQIDSPSAADHRADIYSLGVVLYEMLTGELPAQGLQPPSRKVRTDVRLDEVVLRALEKSPELRWQTAADLRAEVESISGAMVPRKKPRSAGRVLALCLPSTVFAWFVLIGYQALGIDLDADVRAWAGMIGFPLSAAFGGLMAWRPHTPPSSAEPAEQARRWSVRSIVATSLLVVSVLLMGGGMVMLALVRGESGGWNPATGELIFVLVCSGGGILSALSTTLLGRMARNQMRREPRHWRGANGAFASAWFWPGVAVGTLLLSLPFLGIRQSAATAATGAIPLVPPVVVRTEPTSGARDVAPGPAEIRVRFSKNMMDESWSWSSAWSDSTPEATGPPYFQNPRTCVLKVKLEPGRTYAYWLNSAAFQNFQDTNGLPAVPYLLIFQTRVASGSTNHNPEL